ncbi:MAG: homoserine dehydrogenase [Litorilinea sp.]|nr:MAG: homoserine dehydrogenase [Litorilinea sp.]
MRVLHVILFGVGGVGRALVRQMVEHRSLHALRYGLTLPIVALCDRDGAVVDETGIDDEALLQLVDFKAQGGRLANHPLGGPQGDPAGIVDIAGRDDTVVVDCTASEATVPALLLALERGYKIVLANKKPLTVDQEVYDRLAAAGATAGEEGGPAHSLTHHLGMSRWETTVGAGLPVIATLNRLVASGDEVSRIAGTFSGTLGYVMTGLQEGRRFSEIVREAHRLGYTEPDPRDDLGGIDVARKALILARGLGWRLDLADVQVTGLYPPEMDSLSVQEFLDALPQLDETFQRQVAEAAAQGQVLRYAATVEGQQCRVGPTLVSADSPLGRLRGTDNLVEFHTRWYHPNPLVIQGRGAGVDATAAGVLSDIVELAFTG